MRTKIAKSHRKIFEFIKSYSLKQVFMKTTYFISGILVSRCTVFNRYYPFGVSLCACIRDLQSGTLAIGILLGYFSNIGIGFGVRYISTVISILAIKWALNDFPKLKNHFLYIPLTVFFSSFATGVAMRFSGKICVKDFSIVMLEALISSGVAYFFDKSIKIFSEKKISSLNMRDFTYVSISFGILFLSMADISFFGISVGKTFAICFIMIFAYLNDIIGGTIVGTTAGVAIGLSSCEFTYISGCYAFGGILAGIFSKFGKVAVCFSFLFANILLSFSSGDSEKIVSIVYESISAGIIFLILPMDFFDSIKMPVIFGESSESKNLEGLKNIISNKLFSVSKAIKSLPGLVESVSSKIQDNSEIDFRKVCTDSACEVCGFCKLKTFCWSKESNLARKNFEHIIGLVSKKEYISTKDFSLDFLKRCDRSEMIVKKISQSYADFCKEKVNKDKIFNVKTAVSEQILGVGELIENISNEFSESYIYDEEFSELLSREFINLEINVNKFICQKDKFGHLFLDIKCDKIISDKFDDEFLERISCVCSRNFSNPIINIFDDICQVKIYEIPRLRIDFGVCQHAFNNGKYCGDSCCNFPNGSGKYNVIISDGMGTGAEASKQSALTISLMKIFSELGMDFNSSLKILNSALMINSKNEEVLSTLDVVSIDLFSGNTKFMKAGSPITFLIKNNVVLKMDFESLPIGILNDASFSVKSTNLNIGDWIIMMSDGATDIGEEWIFDILNSKNYRTPQELSRILLNKAVKIRKNFHDDDITIAVMKISKNY